MAFAVTPTSGAGPYTLSADIDDITYIDGVHYTASVMSSILLGSCPVVGDETPLTPQQLDDIISHGNASTNVGVASGYCRTFTLALSRVSDNVVVASSSVSVDNV